MENYNKCSCSSSLDSRPIYDGYGIYLCSVCDNCAKERLSKYRKDIFERYDCDEDIENDY